MTYLATLDLPLDTLTTYPGNPRRGNIPVVEESLRRNDQYRAIVVQAVDPTNPAAGGTILAGNHTFLGARNIGMPTIRAELHHVDDETAKRIVAVDNRSADLGGYDDRLLAELLSGLDDLGGTGYDNDDLDKLVASLDEDNVTHLPPEEPAEHGPSGLPADPITVPGDVWLLGRHRLLCGDATNPDHLTLVMDGTTPGIVHTDPPYGISIMNSLGKVGGGGAVSGKVGAGKVVPSTVYPAFQGDNGTDSARDAFTLLWSSYPEAAHVWWGANHYAASAAMPDASCWLVWDKENGDTNFADCELAWTSHKGAVRQFRHLWNGMLRASERTPRVHPTQKPAALVEWAFTVIDANSDRDTVLDVFGGSGSTLIAAEQTDRTAHLIELAPVYCDVICRRYQTHTGIIPVRDGHPHDFTATGE